MKQPDISIIIATRNRKKILWQTVNKACEAVENKNAEIIIVNDADITLDIPVLFAGKINYFDNPKRGVSSARNFGTLNAKGSILFFIDDDMWINSKIIDWINTNLVKKKNTAAAYLIDWEYPAPLNKTLAQSKIGRYILSTGYNTMWGRMHQEGKKPAIGLYKYNVIGSGSLVIEKNIIEQLGMYNESFVFQGEDIDLSKRINDLSIPIFCVFDTTLYHNQEDRLDLDGYLKRDNNGYRTQFMAEKAGLISTSVSHYTRSMICVFEIFRVSEKTWIGLYKLIPNHQFFLPLTNRLTGVLSGLQRYKQWRNIIGSN